MKTWTPIFNFFAVVVLIIVAMTYINYSRVIDYEFEEERYNYAVDQATEAMFRTTIQSDDLGLDYTDIAYVTINSSEALEIFDRVICANYNLASSEENFSDINDSIACVILAGYGGYYIGRYEESDTISDGNPRDSYELKFSVRYPYFSYNGTNSIAPVSGETTTVYAIDAYKYTYYSMGTTSEKSDTDPTLKLSGHTLPAGVSESSLASAINSQIKAAIDSELKNSYNVTISDLSNYRFYFPDETTVTGVNPFSVPGIIMVMQPSKFSNTVNSKVSTMSVSGFKVVTPTKVIAFTDTLTGRAYYCYESQLRDEEKDAASGGINLGDGYGVYHIDDYFDNIVDACKSKNSYGYYYAPYYDIMTRKVVSK
jgi:hypothetical protein